MAHRDHFDLYATIALAALTALLTIAALAAVNYVRKRRGAIDDYKFTRLDRWCDRAFGAWRIWRLGLWTGYAAALVWFGHLTSAIGGPILAVAVGHRAFLDAWCLHREDMKP